MWSKLFTQTNTTLPYHPIPPCATTSPALCCYAPPEMLWILIFKQKDLLFYLYWISILMWTCVYAAFESDGNARKCCYHSFFIQELNSTIDTIPVTSADAEGRLSTLNLTCSYFRAASVLSVRWVLSDHCWCNYSVCYHTLKSGWHMVIAVPMTISQESVTQWKNWATVFLLSFFFAGRCCHQRWGL